MPDSERWWIRGGNAAAMATAIIVAYGICDASQVGHDSARMQREAIAVGVFQDYLRLAIDHPDLADHPDAQSVQGRYEWFASHAFASAETIYRLTHGDPSWDSTVTAIVQNHHGLVRDGRFACQDYSALFDTLVKRTLPQEYKCE